MDVPFLSYFGGNNSYQTPLLSPLIHLDFSSWLVCEENIFDLTRQFFGIYCPQLAGDIDFQKLWCITLKENRPFLHLLKNTITFDNSWCL